MDAPPGSTGRSDPARGLEGVARVRACVSPRPWHVKPSLVLWFKRGCPRWAVPCQDPTGGSRMDRAGVQGLPRWQAPPLRVVRPVMLSYFFSYVKINERCQIWPQIFVMYVKNAANSQNFWVTNRPKITVIPVTNAADFPAFRVTTRPKLPLCLLGTPMRRSFCFSALQAVKKTNASSAFFYGNFSPKFMLSMTMIASLRQTKGAATLTAMSSVLRRNQREKQKPAP